MTAADVKNLTIRSKCKLNLTTSRRFNCSVSARYSLPSWRDAMAYFQEPIINKLSGVIKQQKQKKKNKK